MRYLPLLKNEWAIGVLHGSLEHRPCLLSHFIGRAAGRSAEGRRKRVKRTVGARVLPKELL
jgi:hypothetical protein